MRLFAIVADVNKDGYSGNERNIVMEYLQRQFSSELVEKFIRYFDERLLYYHPNQMFENDDEAQKQNLENEMKILEICRQINEELQQEQKVVLLVHLFDFINRGDDLTDNELKFVTSVAEGLNINKDDFEDIERFTLRQVDRISRRENILYIDADAQFKHPLIKHIYNEKMDGRLSVLHVPSTNTLIFRYYGNSQLYLHGQAIKFNRTYIWSMGAVIKGPIVGSFYYSRIAAMFLHSSSANKFVFTVHDVEYLFGGGINGIRKFNFNEESGQLIGVIGVSGSGKSTMLNVLNGNLKPKSGSVQINGFDIHQYKEELKGVMGYVPQDEFIIKELTVWENLYFNAKLCFKDYTEARIVKVVNDALLNFDLLEARDLRVGDAYRTILSGGQRKRLNIALELMREPAILFVDEPTSGLSSADSEKVMQLLKRQTFKGKLVLTIIHQPSSDIFKMFDKLMVLDQGGRVIYYGNPLDGIMYFKSAGKLVDAEESECLTCGNVNSEQILRIVEARVVDVNGRLTRKRKVSPQEWYEQYLEKIDSRIKRIIRPHNNTIPRSEFSSPGLFEQFRIFFRRDLLAKLSNSQYLFLTLSEAPLLAIILAFFTKHFSGSFDNPGAYVFSENSNLPAYLFMAVIVALFLGLVISAEEIFKDRKLLKRESFLDLSRFSYLGAKIMILFMIAALQSLAFVLIGNYILEIREMTFRYWLILFTTICWANLVGLNISSGFNSVVTIYILIPLILVPQLLFSGVVVDFNNMHKRITNDRYVPLIGDMMTSRWSYEAIVVTQFKKNKFEKEFYEVEKQISNSLYARSFLIPMLENLTSECLENLENKRNLEKTIHRLKILRYEVKKLSRNLRIPATGLVDSISPDNFNDTTAQRVLNFLVQAGKNYNVRHSLAIGQRDRIYANLIDKLGSKEAFYQFREKYYNKQLASIVLNDKEIIELTIGDNEIRRTKDQIFRDPASGYGRAHYFAPIKKIGMLRIDTFLFNLMVIWLFTVLLGVVLYYDFLRIVITYIERFQLNRVNKRIFNILTQITGNSAS